MKTTRQTNLRAIRVRRSSWLAGHQAPRESFDLVQRKVDRGEVRPRQMRCQVFRWGQQWKQVCCHLLSVYRAEFWRFSVPEMSRTKSIAGIVYRGRSHKYCVCNICRGPLNQILFLCWIQESRTDFRLPKYFTTFTAIKCFHLIPDPWWCASF